MTRRLSLDWDGHPVHIDIGAGGVERVGFGDALPCPLPEIWDTTPEADSLAAEVLRQMQMYREGQRRAFTLPLAVPDATPWRRLVWDTLPTIPYGTVIRYRDLAERVGCPNAARALGQACAANPLPILIPCHRVVGARGALGGYVGGLSMKRFLLRIEGASGIELPVA